MGIKRDNRTPLYESPNSVIRYDENPDVSLWRGVILQALFDSLLKPRSEEVRNTKRLRINKEHNKVIAEAKEYLGSPSDGLQSDCDLANLSMDCVIRQYKLQQEIRYGKAKS